MNQYMIPLIFFLLFQNESKNNSHILYHEFFQSASRNVLTKWEIDSDSLPEYYIEETIDEHYRVVKIRFLRNGKLYYSLGYCPPLIIFEYSDNNIIVKRYASEMDTLNAHFTEMPWQIIYTLNEKNEIIGTESYFYFGNYARKRNNIGEWIDTLKLIFEEDRISSMMIYEYYYSVAKYKGIHPVKVDFKMPEYFESPVKIK